MKWRAVASAQWSRNRLSAGVQGQYYGAFSTQYLTGSADYGGLLGFTQQIKASTYLDATIGYRSDIAVAGRKASILYRLGVRNLLDLAPSPISNLLLPTLSNPYNDLVGRRFELRMVCDF